MKGSLIMVFNKVDSNLESRDINRRYNWKKMIEILKKNYSILRLKYNILSLYNE